MWKLRVSEEEEGDKWLKSVNRHIGRQYWEYDPNLGTPSDIAQIEEFRHQFHEKRHQIKHSSDLLMRFQFAKEKADEKMPPKEEDREELEGVTSSLRKALRFYSTLQTEDGNWPGDYAGPLFLLPSLVMGLHVTGSLNTILSSHHQQEIRRYMYNHQNADGGWGLHIEGHSTMFCTVLQYACLRLMGEEIDGGDGAMEKARKWVIDRGGAIFIPSWGKLWLSVALLLSRFSFKNVGEAIAEDRLYDAVHVLLSLQNSNGGFASYELTRSYAWLEVINPTETFGDTVIDYQYVECTSAAIQALKSFITLHPRHRKKEVLSCIAKAADFIQTMQLPDGAWYGSWGVCFTYGTWFGIKGLVAAGKTYENSDNIRRACDFLLSKQLDSGGWGESYLSCQDKVYTNLEGNISHTVNTSWAMLALLEAGQANRDLKSLHRAAKVLMDSQMENGDFPQQEIIGVFNKSCMISYSAYRNIFSIWALGEYRNHVSRILEVGSHQQYC